MVMEVFIRLTGVRVVFLKLLVVLAFGVRDGVAASMLVLATMGVSLSSESVHK